VVDDGDILVIGSQSILASIDERYLPDEATRSVEADVAFFDDPHERKSDAVDAALGEGSQFHESFGYYAQGVSLSTAVLPQGWRDRLVNVGWADALPSRARCLDAHDLVVAKLVAGRQKDVEFATALIEVELIDVRTLTARVELLSGPHIVKDRVRALIQACARAAGYG
jgi:hypothetical protein